MIRFRAVDSMGVHVSNEALGLFSSTGSYRVEKLRKRERSRERERATQGGA
jgi:hypothetical protein